MRKIWHTTVTAAVCAVGVAAPSADGSPAATASAPLLPSRAFATPATNITPIVTASESRPSDEISPFRNPVKYFAATMSELPLGWNSDEPDTNPKVPAVEPKKDSISLDKPVGPATAEFFVSMGQLAELQGDVARAREQYQRALALWPGHVDVLRAAARMEDRQGDLHLAELLYGQAVAANPRHAGALNDLGLCLARQGRLEPSVQTIEQAINLQPNKALYRNNAATVLVEMRQDQRALAHLAAVHGPAEANYNLGQLLVQRGRAPEAMPFFQAAIEQNPQLHAAQVALAQLQGPRPPATQMPVAAPTMASEPTSTPAAPNAAPAQAPAMGPQLGYPATARSPDPGASSYAPPRYYAPTQPFAPPSDPRFGARPQYLPPVAAPSAGVRR